MASGVDLVNYSELYHPLSLHNVACNRDRMLTVPSDLSEARDRLQFVQKGFYSKEALVSNNKYAVQSEGLL